MKRLAGLLSIAIALLGCVEQREAPLITVESRVSRRAPAAQAQLDLGRRLFVTRCIECHSLPAVHAYPADAWPGIVGWMAPRSGLTTEEGRAVAAYVVAAHARR